MPKKVGLGLFADLRGAWQERGGEIETPMHTMYKELRMAAFGHGIDHLEIVISPQT